MKLVKKLMIICIFGFLPAAVLAVQQHKHRHHKLSHSSNHQVATISNKANTTVPSPDNVNNLRGTPAKIVSDILPIAQATLRKPWLKNSDIHKILTKAQKNGQLFYVIGRLEKMQLPKSLALIPVIESRYKSVAKSNKGAGGIWQLMPTTAKQLGIKNQDRFRLASSTNAALRYFKSLHHEFGNWELAIAAYNAGNGRVRHALHLNPNARTVQELKLPRETKQYVLKFYALENYISNANA